TATATVPPTPTPTPCVFTVVSYSGPPVDMPDNVPAGVNIPIAVSSGLGPITHLAFSFDGTASSSDPTSTTVGVNHSYLGDLKFILTSPMGTMVTFYNRPTGGSGGCASNNLYQLVLDDFSVLPVGAQCPGDTNAGPETGNFTP